VARLITLVVVLVTALVVPGGAAQAQYLSCTDMNISRFTYSNCYGSGGYSSSGSSMQIGRFTYGNSYDNYGSISSTSTRLSPFSFSNWSDSSGGYGSGTTTRLGRSSFSNWSDSYGSGYGSTMGIGSGMQSGSYYYSPRSYTSSCSRYDRNRGNC
jgi:hypothetical protein